MGRRGPLPEPKPLKLLKGSDPNTGRDEPLPRDLPAQPPGFLSPLASLEWRRILPDLDFMGVTKAVDQSTLAAYCESFARWRTLMEIAQSSPPLLKGRDGGLVKNPIQSQVGQASSELRAWCREFGLTPASRAVLRSEDTQIAVASAERLLSG